MAKKKKATAKKKATTSLSDIYNEVAKRADKPGISVNATETKRVLACFFDVLEDHSPQVAFDLIAKGLKQSGTRRR
ncbi:MAG: hypothetical protein AB8B55_16975 [Mariniblastus sp.]